jgi:hypothetical protein
MNEEQTKLVEGLCAQCLGWRERAQDGVALPTGGAMTDISNEALDALVKRLRLFSVCWGDEACIAPHPKRHPGITTGTVIGATSDAAAAITALRAKVARLTAEQDYDRRQSEHKSTVIDKLNATIDRLAATLDGLTAERDAARNAANQMLENSNTQFHRAEAAEAALPAAVAAALEEAARKLDKARGVIAEPYGKVLMGTYAAAIRLMVEPAGRAALDAMLAEAREDVIKHGTPRYRLTWIAGARPPVHPEPMTGCAIFLSEGQAWRSFRNMAPDALFVSLSKSVTINCGEVTPPADLADRAALKGGEV